MHLLHIHPVMRNSNRVAEMACKLTVVAGLALSVTACGNLKQTELLEPAGQTTPVDSPSRMALKDTNKRPPVAAPDAGSATRAYMPDVRKALVADHGEAAYICTPSGFGQTATCRLRS